MAIYKRNKNYELSMYTNSDILSEVGENIYINRNRIYIDLNDRPGLGHNPRLKIMYPNKYSGGAVGVKYCENGYAIMYPAETGGSISKETKAIIKNNELLDVLKRFAVFNRDIILYAHVNFGDQYLHDKVRDAFTKFNLKNKSEIDISKLVYAERKDNIDRIMREFAMKGVNYSDEISGKFL